MFKALRTLVRHFFAAVRRLFIQARNRLSKPRYIQSPALPVDMDSGAYNLDPYRHVTLSPFGFAMTPAERARAREQDASDRAFYRGLLKLLKNSPRLPFANEVRNIDPSIEQPIEQPIKRAMGAKRMTKENGNNKVTVSVVGSIGTSDMPIVSSGACTVALKWPLFDLYHDLKAMDDDGCEKVVVTIPSDIKGLDVFNIRVIGICTLMFILGEPSSVRSIVFAVAGNPVAFKPIMDVVASA